MRVSYPHSFANVPRNDTEWGINMRSEDGSGFRSRNSLFPWLPFSRNSFPSEISDLRRPILGFHAWKACNFVLREHESFAWTLIFSFLHFPLSLLSMRKKRARQTIHPDFPSVHSHISRFPTTFSHASSFLLLIHRSFVIVSHPCSLIGLRKWWSVGYDEIEVSCKSSCPCYCAGITLELEFHPLIALPHNLSSSACQKMRKFSSYVLTSASSVTSHPMFCDHYVHPILLVTSTMLQCLFISNVLISDRES